MLRESMLGLLLFVASSAFAQSDLYKVVDGYKVDPDTMKGFRTWRAAACDQIGRAHV